MKPIHHLLLALPLLAPGVAWGQTQGGGGSSGNVGGYTATATTSPTVTASAYSAGYTMGGLLTISGLVRATQYSTLIQSVAVSFADAQTPSIDVILFNASPTSSTTTDHVAFSLAAADIPKVIGVVHASDCSASGTPTVCQAQQQAIPFVSGTLGGSVYAVVVSRAAITPGSTSDLTVTIGTLED